MLQTTLDFPAYIAERARDFTGRKWVFAEIDRWLADPDAPWIFLLTGEPGIGKTAVAARLTQFSAGDVAPPAGYTHVGPGFLSAIHFCSARNGSWISPDSFTRFLSSQLADRHPAFAEALAYDPRIHIEQNIDTVSGTVIGAQITNYYAESPEALFNDLVRRPLQDLYGNGFPGQLVVLVDGLDEALSYSGRVSIVHLLTSCGDLPHQVRLLITSRPVDAVLGPFHSLQPFVLYARSEENLRDLGTYVRHQFDISEALRREASDGAQVDRAITGLVERSQGNFLVVSKVLDAIKQGELNLADPEVLPAELKDLYAWFLERLTKGDIDRWRHVYRPVMASLAVALEPVDVATLCKWTGLTRQQMRDTLYDLREFLDPALDREYRLYHESVVDFLTEDESSPYYIETSETHLQIANSYLERFDPNWTYCDSYGLRHLATHLAEARQWETLHRLIGQPSRRSHDWAQARFEVEKNYDGYLRDLELVTSAARQAGPVTIGWQIRYTLIRASVKTIATNLPPGLLVSALRHDLLSPLKALGYAEQSTDFDLRKWSLAAVLPYTNDGTCRRLLKDLYPTLYFQHYSNLRILKALFQNLMDRGWVDEAVNSIGCVSHLADWSKVLAELAGNVSLSLRNRISIRLLEVIEEGRISDRNVAGALARWAAVLPPEYQTPILAKARERLLSETAYVSLHREKTPDDTLEDDLMWFIEETTDWNTSEHVLELIPFLAHLETEGRKQILESALDAARRNSQRYHCMSQQSLLLEYLDEPERSKIELETRQYWCNNEFKSWFLTWILPYYVRALPPERRLDMVREIILSQLSSSLRALHLSAFVPHLDIPHRMEVIQKALTSLYETPDWTKDRDRVKAFDRLCPFLTRSQVAEILDSTIRIGDFGDQIIGKTAFAKRAETEMERAVRGAFQPPFRSIQSQMGYWDSLRTFARNQALEGGLRTSEWDWSAFRNDTQDERIHGYVARLEEEDPEQVRQRILANRRFRYQGFSRDEQIRLLTVQAAKHQGRLRRMLLNKAVEHAFTEGHEIGLARLLEDILPLCDPDWQVELAEEVLSYVAKYKLDDVIAVTTASLLSYSDPTKRAEWLRASLQRALAARAWSFRKANYSFDQIVLAMSSFWQEFSREELYDIWLEILDAIARFSRPDLLVSLAALNPLVSQLGGPGVEQQVIQAIEDISRWWP